MVPPIEPIHSPAAQLSFPSVVCQASSLPSGSSQARPPVPVPTSTTCPGLRHLSTSCLHLRNPVRFRLLHATSPMAQNVLSSLSLLQPTGPHAVCLMLSNVTEWQMQDRCPGWASPGGRAAWRLPAGGGQQGPVLGSTRRAGIRRGGHTASFSPVTCWRPPIS